MTDRGAAQAVGLNPDTIAYTKSKPCVRAYMVEHRGAVEQQLVEQETEGLRQSNLGREQILARLWEIANLGPEMSRGSITGQVKALAMIVAIESLIPDRSAGSSAKESAPPPPTIAFNPSQSAFANHLSPLETTPSKPTAPMYVSAPDTRVPFSIKKYPNARRR